jgi:hypothetical protein
VIVRKPLKNPETVAGVLTNGLKEKTEDANSSVFSFVSAFSAGFCQHAHSGSGVTAV